MYKICDTYEDWEIHVKSKLPMGTDYKNYLHWLIMQRQFAERELEIVKAILIPIYIALLSVNEIFSPKKTSGLSTVLILSVVIVIISAYILWIEKKNLNFWNNWIEIVHSVM